jgi:hypothetical protein
MDGVALSSINPNILILDIGADSKQQNISTSAIGNRHGARIVKKKFETAKVTISLEIHEYDIVKRQAVCQDIARWALNGTYLTINDRPGQRLRVVCEALPTIESAKKWLDEVQVVFAGYNPPFWEEENVMAVTLGGTNGATSGSTTAKIPGNANETLISATITAKASVSSFSVTANGKTISLSGLSLSSGDAVTIDYDDNMIIRIRKGTTSLLDKRTAASADDLMVDSGKENAFSFTSSGNAVVSFNIRGWWQ